MIMFKYIDKISIHSFIYCSIHRPIHIYYLIGQLLKRNDSDLIHDFRDRMKSISRRWPNIRATAVVGMGVDFTLIPRAMQAEEDLMRFIKQFKAQMMMTKTEQQA